MNLDLIMLNHTQRKYSDADIFKEHEELKKIFTQLEADGIEIKGRLREKLQRQCTFPLHRLEKLRT